MGMMYVGMGMWVWRCLVSRYGDDVCGYGDVGMGIPYEQVWG